MLLMLPLSDGVLRLDDKADDYALPEGEEPPGYWENATGDFDEVYPVRMSAAGGLNDLLTGTYIPKKTRDRPGDLPAAFRMLKASRVEDAGMWKSYAERREEIRASMEARAADGDPQITEYVFFQLRVRTDFC